jgi:hypothetical protein
MEVIKMNNLKCFVNNIKKYLGYIATLGFKDLGRHFLSLLLLIFISLLAYIPVGLVGDFIITMITSVGNVPSIIYSIVDIVIELISLIAAVYLFIFIFNRRYTELYVDEMNGKGKEKKEEVKIYDNRVEQKIELPELDLPKKK